MSKLLDDLRKRLDAYDATTWDEDDENYSPDRASLASLFSGIYYGEYEYEDGDDYEYTEYPNPPFELELPFVGTIKVVDRCDDHDDGHALYVVFEWNGELFQYQGWDNSWSGDGGFDGPLRQVKAKQITTTIYERVAGPSY